MSICLSLSLSIYIFLPEAVVGGAEVDRQARLLSYLTLMLVQRY